MRSVLLLCLSLIFASVIFAAEDGFTDYLIAITKPATEEKFRKAKADVEKLGGKVKYEIHLGMEGISASLPSDQIQSMENHDYIDFVDIDKEVHAF